MGDTLTLPSDNGNVELEIIGTSDNFVLPFSFFSSDKDITVYDKEKIVRLIVFVIQAHL